MESDSNIQTPNFPLGDGAGVRVWQFIQEKLNASTRVILLYVLESEGSSPGRQGFKMAVAADGTFNGTIGGGIMEHKLVEKAKQMLVDNATVIEVMRQYHDKEKGSDRSGMICSGSQLNAFIPLGLEDKEFKDALPVTDPPDMTHRKKIIEICPNGISLRDSVSTDKKFNFKFQSETDWLYSERIDPRPVIHIIGGGHVSLALSELMLFLGFYIKVYDDRPALHTMEENVFAQEKQYLADYQELAKYMNAERDDNAVIITFGYRTDKEALKQLLNKEFAYLGLIGSDKKIETLFKELEEEGIEPGKLKSIFAPVGINIFSRTAPEIAVSIAAEIIREKNKDLPTGRHSS